MIRLPRGVAVVALAAGLALAPGGAARAATPGPGAAAPAAAPATALTAGRLLVLHPHRLDVVLDGRVLRSVPISGPVDLGDLPWLAGEADYAAPLDDGTSGLRLGAVLVQRPGTVVVGAGLRLELLDTGGAGPGRLTGSGARLSLRRTVVVPAAVPWTPGTAAAGVRYLAGSVVTLEDVTLDGLGRDRRGSLGAGPEAAVRVDAGSTVVLRRVAVAGGGRGVEVRDPARLLVAGLDGDHVRGPLLDLSGGTGARLGDVTSDGATGPAVRIRGSADTGIDGLTSSDDAIALAAEDVVGLRAAGVLARGDGLAVAGRGVELVAPDVDTPGDAVRVGPGAEVTVRGGVLRGRTAVAAEEGTAAALQDVVTVGALHGPVRIGRTVRDPAPARSWSRSWWDRPVQGAGAVAVVALVAGLALELLRGRTRPGGADDGGHESTGAAGEPVAVGWDGEPVLDLGEQRVH